jgi:dihydrodipicolinate synthase/N-acetylneuraminate lyase
MKQLQGVFAPVVTTFYRESGEVDVASFAANIRAHLAAGLNGIVVTGSTGEAALLDSDERSALIDAAREMVPRDKVLLIGTGAESTRTCLRFTRDAASRGADGVLVVAPHYYGGAMNDAALRAHYLRVADASPVPVVLYSIPKYMHFALSAALVGELAEHPNIIGIKDSSGNKETLAGYLAAQSDSFTVFTGNAPAFHHALQAGARGGILAAALFAAGLSMDVYDSFKRGDETAATAAQVRHAQLGAKIVGELGVPGVKAAMDRVGLTGGPVRAPLAQLTDDQLATVTLLMQSAELAAA